VFFLRPRRRRFVFWGAAALGLVAALTLVDRSFIDRMSTIKSAVREGRESMDSSAESRLVLAIAQLQMAARFPHGSGNRGTAALSPQYLDERWLAKDAGYEAARSSHNTFMTMLVEQGVLGAILYLWMTLWGLAAIPRARTALLRGVPYETIAPVIACCAGLAVVWTAGHFTDYVLAEVQVWLAAVLAAGLVGMRQAMGTGVEPSVQAPSSRRILDTGRQVASS
jgi:O-antigen ligase